MTETDLLAGAAKSATYNVILRFIMRVMTFVLNGFILRYVMADMLGVVNVRLLLLYTTIQFISGEGFRRACLSQGVKSRWSQVICLMWYSVPVTAVVACLFGSIWLYVLEAPTTIPHYRSAVVVFATCAVIEATVEPLLLTARALLFVKLRVIVEGVSNLVKCLVTVALVTLTPHLGLYIFCISQVCASAVFPICYYAYFCLYIKSQQRKKDNSFPLTRTSQLFPFTTPGHPRIDWPTAVLVWSFFKQSVLKQFLTEGERYAMTLFNIISFSDQGVFDVVNNLGSLMVRTVFAAVEESGYLFFSRSLTRGLPSRKQPEECLRLCSNVLRCLLKTSILLGVTSVVFGYPYSQVALHIYGGHTLSSGIGPSLLRSYCVYVSIIALNGVTECFVFAAMSQKEVDRYNHKMVVFSVLLLISSWYLTQLFGVIGLVLANCVNMAARIIHSIRYIQRFYHNGTSPLVSLQLSPIVIVSYIVVFGVMCFSQAWFTTKVNPAGYIVHIFVGSVCFLAQLAVIYKCEKELVDFVMSQYRLRKEKQT